MDRVNERPVAHLIADFSSAVDLFTLTTDPKTMSANLIKANGHADQISQTPADRCLQGIWTSMKEDHIGGEDFNTISETPKVIIDATADVRAYTSLHRMILGVRGEQAFHYHPPVKDYKESAQRAVLIIGLHNKTTGASGCKFEYFGTQDNSLVTREDDTYPHLQAQPVDPMYNIEVKAGQVALVVFGAGVHRFAGQALAVSGHFFDVSNVRDNEGSFLGNTAGYRGEFPTETKQIHVKNDGAIILPEGVRRPSNNVLYDLHTGAVREMDDQINNKHYSRRFNADATKRKGEPGGASARRINSTVKKLHSVAQNSISMPVAQVG